MTISISSHNAPHIIQYQRTLNRIGLDFVYSLEFESYCVLKVLPNNEIAVMSVSDDEISSDMKNIWDIAGRFFHMSDVDVCIEPYGTRTSISAPTAWGNLTQYNGYGNWNGLDLSIMPDEMLARQLVAYVELGVVNSINMDQLISVMSDSALGLVSALITISDKAKTSFTHHALNKAITILDLSAEDIVIRSNEYVFYFSEELNRTLLTGRVLNA